METIYVRLQNLCKQKGVSISKMERELGFARGLAYKWNTSVPSAITVMKLAEYFSVDPMYITEGIQKEDKIDIKEDLKRLLMYIGNDTVNLFYGDKEVDEKTRQLLEIRFRGIMDALDISLK